MSYLEFWHWWALALCFVVVEALIPSGVFTSMALAGGITGALFLAMPDLSWQAQLGAFGAFTLVLSYPLTYLFQRKLAGKETAVSAARKVVGKELELAVPIQNGFGEIEIDGTIWSLKGPELKKGEKVKVVGLDGDMLVVVPVNRKIDPDQIAR